MSCDLLVGSTGFVGGNLLAKHTFAAACHSSDITAQYGTRPDLCVYAGVPAGHVPGQRRPGGRPCHHARRAGRISAKSRPKDLS